MCLEQEERLEVGRVVVDVFELDGDTLVNPAKKYILVMPDGNAFEFGGRSNNLQETLELGTLLE